MLVGGVDRSKLSVNATDTILEILTIQQNLILDKANKLLLSLNEEEKTNARQAINLIEKSRDLSSIEKCDKNLLYPSEYKVRADALVEARRLVGGVVLEQVK